MATASKFQDPIRIPGFAASIVQELRAKFNV